MEGVLEWWADLLDPDQGKKLVHVRATADGDKLFTATETYYECDPFFNLDGEYPEFWLDERGDLIVWRDVRSSGVSGTLVQRERCVLERLTVSRDGMVRPVDVHVRETKSRAGRGVEQLAARRLVLQCGRGFAKHLEEITEISSSTNGQRVVRARGHWNSLRGTWLLEITDNDYLVRRARFFRADDSVEPVFTIRTEGEIRSDGLILAERGFLSGKIGEKPYVSGSTVTKLTNTTDRELAEAVASELAKALPIGSTFKDYTKAKEDEP